MANLLDKFYGDGIKRGLFGEYAGYINHLNDNSAVVYDKYGQFNGRIDVYGEKVVVQDKDGMVVETGTYYENTDSISVFDNRAGYQTKEITYNDGCSYATNKYDLMSSESMYSSDCCGDCEDDYLTTGWIDDLFD